MVPRFETEKGIKLKAYVSIMEVNIPLMSLGFFASLEAFVESTLPPTLLYKMV